MASARCVKCMNPAQNMCDRCKLQTYCSNACFSTHSEAHRRVCGHLIRVKDTSIAYLFKRTLVFGDDAANTIPRPNELNDTLRLLSSDELFNAVSAYALGCQTPVSDAVLQTVISEVCSSEQYASDAAAPAVTRGVVPITATSFQLQTQQQQQPQRSRQLLVNSPPPSITTPYSSAQATPSSPSSPKPFQQQLRHSPSESQSRAANNTDLDIDFGNTNFASGAKQQQQQQQMQSLGSSPWRRMTTAPAPRSSALQQQQQQPPPPTQSAMSPIDACVDAIVERCVDMKRVAKLLADAAASPNRTTDEIVADGGISISVGTDLEVHGESGSSEFLVFRRGRVRIPNSAANFATGSDGAAAAKFISGIVQLPNFALATIAAHATPHFLRIAATSSGPDPRFIAEALVDPWEPHDLALIHEKKRWFTNGGTSTPVPEEYARNIALAARPDFRGALLEKFFLELCLHFAICQFFLGFRLPISHRRGLKVRYVSGSEQQLTYDSGTGILGSLLSHDGNRSAICIRVGEDEPVPVFEELPPKAPSRSGILSAWKSNKTGEFHPGTDPIAAARLVVQLLRLKPTTTNAGAGSAASAGESSAAAEAVSPVVDAIPVFRDYVQSKQKPAAIDFLKHLYVFTKDKYPQWFA